MNHDKDFDRDGDREDYLELGHLKHILQSTYDIETKLMREYLMTSERIHNNPELKERLQNFAEGNAKRTEQLLEELKRIQ